MVGLWSPVPGCRGEAQLSNALTGWSAASTVSWQRRPLARASLKYRQQHGIEENVVAQFNRDEQVALIFDQVGQQIPQRGQPGLTRLPATSTTTVESRRLIRTDRWSGPASTVDGPAAMVASGHPAAHSCTVGRVLSNVMARAWSAANVADGHHDSTTSAAKP